MGRVRSGFRRITRIFEMEIIMKAPSRPIKSVSESTSCEFSEFAGDEPEIFFAPFISGARRLPNGNIFGVSGIVSGMFEVTDEGEEVLRTIPGSRSTFYRAYKFSKDYPAFKSRDLTPLATGWNIPK